MLCDKWDCVDTMKPWVLNWLLASPNNDSAFGIGNKLVAAYYVGAALEFEQLSKMAIQQLPPGFLSTWIAHDLDDLLPSSVHGKSDRPVIRRRIANVLIEAILQAIYKKTAEFGRKVDGCLVRLDAKDSTHSKTVRGCNVCGRELPRDARQCRPCSNKEVGYLDCDAYDRLKNFLGWTMDCYVRTWDTAGPPLSLAKSLQRIRDSTASVISRSRCSADCELNIELSGALQDVEEIFAAVKGLQLSDHRKS
jgi:hypothetical protein